MSEPASPPPEWASTLLHNLAVAGALHKSFWLGHASSSCGNCDPYDDDSWTPNVAGHPSSAEPRRCSCSHEAGDSRCERHPTCSGCGCSTSAVDVLCDGCLPRNAP